MASLTDSHSVLTYLQPAATLENLARLASKPGVQSTLILSKVDGSIIRSTGLLAVSTSLDTASPSISNTPNGNSFEETVDGSSSEGQFAVDTETKSMGNTAEDFAQMVFQFVASARNFTEGMDGSDEVKLLRLRTRKHEIVIVPGKLVLDIQMTAQAYDTADLKFLLVVVHDTPPA